MFDWLIDATKLVIERSKGSSYKLYIWAFFRLWFGLEDNENTDENGLANESLQSSYQWLVV